MTVNKETGKLKRVEMSGEVLPLLLSPGSLNIANIAVGFHALRCNR